MIVSRKRVVQSLLCIGALVVFISGNAQERCGTVQYTQRLKALKAIPASDKVFEQWLEQKVLQRQSGRTQSTQATFQIPVVVHVIHNGEAVGTGTNISDAQIISQIKVLNDDFNRTNPDASDTPSEFLSVAGDMDIEFILAKQDPEGLSTSGIVRKQGTKAEWTINDNYQLKATSYWPAEDYLNIWVCNIDEYLGYTQFPESTLNGLENSSNNRLTDGVVIWYRTFGSINDGPFSLDSKYDLGRTTTHEIGHFLGLRHIWGDDGSSCTGDDYVTDTPNQSGNSTGCPAHPRVTCSANSMFQNFLDYTDDQCMNLFTKGQVSRMITVLQNSPRRASLLNSHGLFNPSPVPNDLGIREIKAPLSSECSNSITPRIVVRNYGNNTVTSTTIRYSINGLLEETKTFTISLGYLEFTEVTFANTNITSGENIFSFEILQTNGVADPVLQNNIETVTLSIPEFGAVPFNEDLQDAPSLWSTYNPDQQKTWALTSAAGDYQDNQALFMNFYDYEDKFGEVDAFVSPVLDLSSSPVASLVFDIAHARYQSSNDRLKVVILRDCESIEEGDVVFDKSGAALATTAAVSAAFTPAGQSDWRRELVNLNAYLGESHIQIAFVGINDWGNNVYLDNISVLTSELEDLTIEKIVSPSLVTCDENPSAVLVVQNLGTVTIRNFKVEYSVNDAPKQVSTIENISLQSISQISVGLPQLSLHEGVNTIKFEIVEPNGHPDQTPSNNVQEFDVIVRKDAEPIPLRQDFDSPFDTWTSFNPTGGMKWETISTDAFKTSMYFNSFNNVLGGDEAWFVSPVLDFSKADDASMVFDLSKRIRPGKGDELKIMASSDCGNTYTQVPVVVTSGFNFSEWLPTTKTDWVQNFKVNLSNFAGYQQVRIAFVATNKNGNNMFIDNLEFFTEQNPELIASETNYSILGYNVSDVKESELKILFNLPQRETVEFAVIDPMGHIFAQGKFENVLNQTWPIDPEKKLASGLYIVRLKIGNKMYADRIIIGR